MSPAIFYHPEAYSTSGPKLMGRNAAGESFLKGFLKYSSGSEFWVQVEMKEHAQHFTNAVKAIGRKEQVRAIVPNNLSTLIQPGIVYFPGPGIAEHAYYRSIVQPASNVSNSNNPHAKWSLCGTLGRHR